MQMYAQTTVDSKSILKKGNEIRSGVQIRKRPSKQERENLQALNPKVRERGRSDYGYGEK